jgi:hypothetical protein
LLLPSWLVIRLKRFELPRFFSAVLAEHVAHLAHEVMLKLVQVAHDPLAEEQEVSDYAHRCERIRRDDSTSKLRSLSF